jgi:acetyl coenzyme A synthetase (ADP forming)-like protein
MKTLDRVFRPKSIAVIGATPRRGTIGRQLLQNIIEYGFNGTVFPVNPKHKYISSIKCYPSVLAIPDPVDLAIVVVPKEHVLRVAEECGKKGVGGLVIISAGFKEAGGEGVAREQALDAIRRKYGFRVVGPNCMGIINTDPDVHLNASFAPLEPVEGSLAFMSQSGALGVAILLMQKKLHLGVSHFVSVGNKLDVAGDHLLEYWDRDKKTKVIALYLESFGDPRRFTTLARRITAKKPIIVVKSGTTAAGSRAATSHTGALAARDIAADALLYQCGVIRVSTTEQMMDVARALANNPIPKGDRVCILTNAGGPAILATDAAVNEGLKMATLSDATRRRLARFLPEESSVRNPIDMISSAGPKEYEKALDLVLGDRGVDMVIVIFVPPILVEPKEVVRGVAKSARRHEKPVLCVLMAEDRYYEEIPHEIENAPPLYRFPEDTVHALSAINRYRRWRERPVGRIKRFPVRDTKVSRIVARKKGAGGGYLAATEASRILDAYGFPLCRFEVVPRGGDFGEAARRIGFPLVLKAHGERIVHKSELGGVVVGIQNRASLEDAVRTMELDLKKAGVSRDVEGFLVQEMAHSGKEVALGMSVDPTFGPLLMFGMGGKYVEVIKDIVFRVMPVTDVDAWEMVGGIRSYPLLEGVRGERRVDIEFIVESIQKLAQMVNDMPDIAELDLNPVIVAPERRYCRVVDARIRVATE